jgi:hypothetical protein
MKRKEKKQKLQKEKAVETDFVLSPIGEKGRQRKL